MSSSSFCLLCWILPERPFFLFLRRRQPLHSTAIIPGPVWYTRHHSEGHTSTIYLCTEE